MKRPVPSLPPRRYMKLTARQRLEVARGLVTAAREHLILAKWHFPSDGEADLKSVLTLGLENDARNLGRLADLIGRRGDTGTENPSPVCLPHVPSPGDFGGPMRDR